MLGLLAGAPVLAAGRAFGLTAPAPKIGRLIGDAQAHAKISQRIETISRALLGARYQAHTLIGGPNRKEVFVVRDDAFDCVTYCEVVLAAAIARDIAEFEPALRRIRYHHGNVGWAERNHYYADWCERNVENRICRPVTISTPVKIHKISNSEPGLGTRQWTIDAMPRATLLSSSELLVAGDIIGFVSRRSNLDYFHTGFVAFGPQRELLLRHASGSHGRVLDERMDRFIAANGPQYVTVLRPEETRPPQGASRNPN